MFICNECELVFSEPKVYSEDRTPGGVFEGGSFIETYKGCPSCGGNYDEAMECQRCEEYISTKSDAPFCTDCINDILSDYATVIKDNFRADEYETILDHLEDLDIYKEEK